MGSIGYKHRAYHKYKQAKINLYKNKLVDLKARKLYLLLYLRTYHKYKQAKINLYKQACRFESAEIIFIIIPPRIL
jgi:hypothetical protein